MKRHCENWEFLPQPVWSIQIPNIKDYEWQESLQRSILICSTIVIVHCNLVFRNVLILFQNLTQYEISFNLENDKNGSIIGGKILLKELLCYTKWPLDCSAENKNYFQY